MTRPVACALVLLWAGAACAPTRDVDARSASGPASRAAETVASTPARLPGSIAHGSARADTAATRELADSLAAYEKRRALAARPRR